MGCRYGCIQAHRQYWQASLHAQLCFSLSLWLVASSFPASDSVTSRGINMTPAAPKLYPDSLKRDPPHSPKRKKRFRVAPPESPLIVARVTDIDWQIHPRSWNQDRVRQRQRKAEGKVYWANKLCADQWPRETDLPSRGGKRCSSQELMSANEWLWSFFTGNSAFPILLVSSQWLYGADIPSSPPTIASFRSVLTAHTDFFCFHLLNAPFLPPKQILVLLF